MSMSTHISGFKPPDDKWKEMKAVYDACEKAQISIPDSVVKFFDYDTPDESGVTTDIMPYASEWRTDGQDGYQIDLSDLPEDIKIIRFFNSY